MRRREFLTGAGGFSVVVLAGKVPGMARQELPADDVRRQFDHAARAAPKPAAGEPHMRLIELEADVLVAGGGLAGVCAAVAAARHGARVVLLQDRSRLGGNSSSEVKMHVVGADAHNSRPGWREGGLIEEFRLDDAVNNPQRSFELWDLLLYNKVVSEPNITLLLETTLYSASKTGDRITEVMARCDKTERLYRIRAKIFCDCTGDSRLALEAGAESRVTAEHLRMRKIISWEYGYWWIEWGGDRDIIADNQRIRFELLAIVLGVWDYIKNGGDHPSSANWAMDWIGMVPGKRGSRRVVGDVMVTQKEVATAGSDYEDAVAIGGWPLDDHPPGGFDRADLPPSRTILPAEVYNLPLRALYSRNVENLMMAGRNISCSHVAFTSARVMATCAVIGQAAGTAAAACVRHEMTPRQLCQRKDKLRELQRALVRDDQTIKNRVNDDPADLARQARVAASGELGEAVAANIIDGHVRDYPLKGGRWEIHHWETPLAKDGAWIELSWDRPQTISEVLITFDSGFHRQLTLSAQESVNRGIIRAPQPETVRDYAVLYRPTAGGELKQLLAVTENHQRLNRHRFAAIQAAAIRMDVRATNGAPNARIFEVRCYA